MIRNLSIKDAFHLNFGYNKVTRKEHFRNTTNIFKNLKKGEDQFMLLTVTMNPSVDISYHLDRLTIDDINRTDEVSKTPGGKGLNVARVAKQLGLDVAATGIIGGHLGDYIKDELEKVSIQQVFYAIDQESRNCIAILHEGNQTEILETGPSLTEVDTSNFLKHFEDLVSSGKYTLITMSGSLPSGMDPTVYKQMIHLANQVGIPIILDASGANLVEALEDESLKLTAIKPNLDELSAIEGSSFSEDGIGAIKDALSRPRYGKCEWIVLSLGGAGALIKHGRQFYRVTVPEIEVVSPVGSGDSTVAGLAYGLLSGGSDEKIMKSAMTAGVLNTMNEQTGSIDVSRFDEIFAQINIEEL